MSRRSDQRGLSSSVQIALLFPLVLGVLLSVMQWSLQYWAEATAMGAAQEGAAVAAALGATSAEGRSAALTAANNGSLSQVKVTVTRGARETTATVEGRGVVVLWAPSVRKTVVVASERVSAP